MTTRTVIAGGPRTGKTTLANTFDGICPVRHTDDLIGSHDWSEASAEVATWFDEPGPWVVEGVATIRALRKWIAAHPTGGPCDVVILLESPHVTLTRAQQAMATGCWTVWREIVDEIVARGVQVRRGLA